MPREYKIDHKLSRAEVEQVRNEKGALAAVEYIAKKIGATVKIEHGSRERKTASVDIGVVELCGDGFSRNVFHLGETVEDAAGNFLKEIMQPTIPDALTHTPLPAHIKVSTRRIGNQWRTQRVQFG